MRCLYCGKELALLKRWTGGGEFCSDAHRQQYQDEYNQLALNRLLQAKPTDSQQASSKPALAEHNARISERSSSASSAHDSDPSRDKQRQLPQAPARPQLAAPAAESLHASHVPQSPNGPQSTHRSQALNGSQSQIPATPLLREPEPKSAPEPLLEPAPDLEAPAEPSGFLLELPVPALAAVANMAPVDLVLESGIPPWLPRGGFEDLETQLFAAGPIESQPYTDIRDCAPRTGDRRLEIREFVRGAPILEANFNTGGYHVPERIDQSMEIPMSPRTPEEPSVWQELWREFEIHPERGALARVAFKTTGLEDNQSGDENGSLSQVAVENAEFSAAKFEARNSAQDRQPERQEQEAQSLAASAPAEAASIESTPESTLAAQVEEYVVKPMEQAAEPGSMPESTTETASSESAHQIKSEPAVAAQAPAEPASKLEKIEQKPAQKPESAKPGAAGPSKFSFMRWGGPQKSESKAPARVEEPKSAEPAAARTTSAKAPAPLTKSMPLTLNGLAAGRGKSVQVFSAPVWAAGDLQIPRSNGLPLRSVMTLAPWPGVAAPAEEKVEKPAENKKEERRDRTVVVKVDPKKARPDVRVSSKVRKDAADAETKTAKPPETKPESESAKVATAKAADNPTADNAGVEKPETKKETADKPADRSASLDKASSGKLPAPMAAPYHSPDLGIPSLDLDTSGGFWSRLPIAGKIGLIMTVIAVIGFVAFILKSSAGSAPAGPRVVEAAAITASEGGWITDWGVEPGVRKVRDFSVLKPTLGLSDYRLQFEAQIETKALGWIYRAQDDKNYYVNKLEVVKPGLEPTVALVRYAVINGEEGPHAQIPLTMPLRIDTMYKLRFDALGDKFTTTVQDQQVDEWTDSRLKKGGVGFYNDRGEAMELKKDSLRVAQLVVTK